MITTALRCRPQRTLTFWVNNTFLNSFLHNDMSNDLTKTKQIQNEVFYHTLWVLVRSKIQLHLYNLTFLGTQTSKKEKAILVFFAHFPHIKDYLVTKFPLFLSFHFPIRRWTGGAMSIPSWKITILASRLCRGVETPRTFYSIFFTESKHGIFQF